MLTAAQSWPLMSFSERQQYLAEAPDRYEIVRGYYQNQPAEMNADMAITLSSAVVHPTQWLMDTYSCSAEEAELFGKEQWLRKLDWMRDFLQSLDPKSAVFTFPDTILGSAQFTLADLSFGDMNAFSLSPEETVCRLQNILSGCLGKNRLFQSKPRILNSAVDCQYWKYHQNSGTRLFCLNEDGPASSR